MQFKGSVFVAKMAFTERDLRKQEPPISRDPIARSPTPGECVLLSFLQCLLQIVLMRIIVGTGTGLIKGTVVAFQGR